MKKERSSKWRFLLYQDSAPKNYIEVLDELQIPYVLSPWHDKDVDSKTGELLKPHKHGVFFFDSLKSESQVSKIVTEHLNGPAKVEIVMSPTGTIHYLTHESNKDKAQYDKKDIEYGCGFDLNKFLSKQNSEDFILKMIDTIEQNDFTEFEELVWFARDNDTALLGLIIERTYFFAKYLDSRRYSAKRRANLMKKDVEAVKEDGYDEVKQD